MDYSIKAQETKSKGAFTLLNIHPDPVKSNSSAIDNQIAVTCEIRKQNVACSLGPASVSIAHLDPQ